MTMTMVWPPDTRESQKVHAFKHVRSLDLAIGLCGSMRTAVQAGGNVGLWPRRLAEAFARVMTFEPEPISLACLIANVGQLPNVEIRSEALGATARRCGIERRSLGSHRVIQGTEYPMVPLDALELPDVDLLQLDLEGYEFNALLGARATIERCHPVIQVELRGFGDAYGASDRAIDDWLSILGYHVKASVPGNDVVFVWR